MGPVAQKPSWSAKSVRIYRSDDGGFFWVEAVEAETGQDLTACRFSVRDAYEGSLLSLWLWHYGSDSLEWSWDLLRSRRLLWAARLMMRIVAPLSRAVLGARWTRWLRRFHRTGSGAPQ